MTEKLSPSTTTVLLVEDNDVLTKSISAALMTENFKVLAAASARQAFTMIFKSPPDLIVLDINLPDLDGFHLAKELKRNLMLRYIPVIILSSRLDFLEKMRSLDVVVDEYLVKPIDIRELIVRAQLVLERSQSNLDANPLTRLPGNRAIVKNLETRVGTGKPYAVGYADLNNFKAYNDRYGFSHGDKLITFTAQLIVGTVQRLSPADNFVGHVGGDDFIFVCEYEKANLICQAITETFDKEAVKFFSEEDRKQGFIVVADRRGVVSQIPLVSIALGMVSDEGRKFSNLGQINHSLTQLKKYAKSFQGSAFVRDRRNLPSQMAEFTWGPGSSAGSSKVLEDIANAVGAFLPEKLQEIIKKQDISILFQPILNMKTDEVYGNESLVRGPVDSPLEFPDALFRTARIANLVLDLDMLCMKKVLQASQEFHKGIKLFINVFPETLQNEKNLSEEVLYDPKLVLMDVVFELSGSGRASDPHVLFNALARLKTKGLKICLDASAALLEQDHRYLADLQPDYIKLNMMHYKDMENDFLKREDFLKMVGLVRQVGAIAICTKLESRADSYLAIKAGVTLGQGFLFARPAQISQSFAQ